MHGQAVATVSLAVCLTACSSWGPFWDVTGPSVPTGLSAGAADSDRIRLTWIEASDDYSSSDSLTYEICRSHAAGGCAAFRTAYTTAAGVTSYDATGLAADTVYYFRVRAKDGQGNTSGTSAEDFAFTNPASAIRNWPDSAQLSCRDALGNVVSCTSNSGSYPGQDADFNLPMPRAYPTPVQYTATGEYTTTDSVTGLSWKSCVEGMSGSSCTTGSALVLTYQAAKTQCAALNTLNGGIGYAAKSGWRLPTKPELQSIIWANVSPAMDSAAFPGFVANVYWTLSSSTLDPLKAWQIEFGLGAAQTASKTGTTNAICVTSANKIPAQTLTDLGDGTIKDQKTGLIWQKCTAGLAGQSCDQGTTVTMSWVNALVYCRSLSLAGRTWHLPAVNELNSVCDESKLNPAINKTAFPGTVGANYWTSTSASNAITDAWYIGFLESQTGRSARSSAYAVRCVAGP